MTVRRATFFVFCLFCGILIVISIYYVLVVLCLQCVFLLQVVFVKCNFEVWLMTEKFLPLGTSKTYTHR